MGQSASLAFVPKLRLVLLRVVRLRHPIPGVVVVVVEEE